jgi:carbon-monoxide dehydrogenase small subunit
MKPVSITVNGVRREIVVEPRRLLSDVLREELGLTGTHVGCEHGVCGACTVWLDDEPVRACLLFAIQADGRRVTTIEGLREGEEMTPLQSAFSACHALQCGFCTPGILMSATAFLRENPNPDADAVRDLLAGHLCRCTGYANIARAILQAAR